MKIRFSALFILVVGAPVLWADDPATRVSVTTDDHGFLVHEIESPYQAGKTQVKVLLPDNLTDNRKLPVVFVLPVEAGDENRYGVGLGEIQKHDLHNKTRAIFVAPTFSHLPWYADHPTDPSIRQETYFLDAVLPLVEKNYPVLTEPGGRLLLGFSKSGWGAWSMLLRRPDVFGRAAAWDAPLMMDRLGKYGTTDVFGTQDHFDRYRIENLLREKKSELAVGRRLILSGYGNFREHHQQAHALLDELHIPHEYQDGPLRQHDWHSGWVEDLVRLLVEPAPSP